MGKKKLITDFTSGCVPKQLALFMLPFMASNAMQVLYSIVDMIIVGQFVGKNGLSAVSQGSMLISFVTCICMGFSTGGQIIISQFIGAQRKKELGDIVGTMFTSMTALSLALTVLVLVFRRNALSLISIPPEAFDMAEDYLVICGAGTIFTGGYNLVSSILRGMGDSRHPFIFIAIASVVNLALDLLFTGVMGLGVAGAAAATILGQAVSVVISLRLLYRRREEFYFDFRPESFRPNAALFGEIFRLGTPLALQACAICGSMMFVNRFINAIGVTSSATFGAGVKLDDISNKLTMGVQYAAAPMIGQNIAAKKHERVKSVFLWCLVLCAVVAGCFVLCYVLIGREMFALFTDEADVLELSGVFIGAILWTFPGMVLMRATQALLQGTGRTTIMMTMAFADATLRVLLSYLFGVSCGMGFYGFVLGFGLAPYGIAVPGLVYFFMGRWKTVRLSSDNEYEKIPA